MTASYLYDNCQESGLPEEIYLNRLRAYLKTEVNFHSSHVEHIFTLLADSIRVKNESITPGIHASVKKQAKQSDKKCYLCGRDIAYDTSEEYNFPEVEHIWPNALGGSNESNNLKIACRHCNQHKKTMINTSDYHFELINNEKIKGLDRGHKLSVWGRNKHSCSICGRPAELVGDLKIERLNNEDSWHYLNLRAFCFKHSFKK